MSYIYLVPIHLQSSVNLEKLTRCVENTFGVRTKTRSFKIDLPGTYDPIRKQYNSSLILRQLIAHPPADACKILGIGAVDLFIPILTYVFGEAQLDGIGAVVSLHRLQNQFYGLPENHTLMQDRLIKEAVHELGHTFGLLHCTNPGCALNASTYVENIDQKSRELCSDCRKAIAFR
ncbi:MAG: archaemetzincin family Zn-dependent metalloprotease [Desulfatirhabdiaceae bacterium]